MPRRSERVRRLQDEGSAKADKTPQENLSDNGALSVKDTDLVSQVREAARPRKVARKTANHASSRRAGKLWRMLEMPLDVILEICALLHPKDVLSLARASRELRQFFMSRNSISVWKAALSNLPDLPACPDDLSLPAYVNLMFNEYCHVCLKKNCRDVYWLSRMRICDACRKKHEVHDGHFDERAAKMIQPYKITELVPPVRYLYHCTKHPLFYEPALTEFVSKLTKMPIAQRRTFLSERKKLIDTREEGAYKLRNFIARSKTSRADELRQQRADRLEHIIAHLKEAGYEEDINYLFNRHPGNERQQFIRMPEVHKPQPLTTRSWNNIRERMINFMKNIREIRLAAARKAVMLQRLATVERLVRKVGSSLRGRKPCVAEIVAGIPEVAQMIDPVREEFDAAALEAALLKLLPTYMKSQEARAREAFGSYITELLSLDATTDPFSIAATRWYSCRHCYGLLDLDGALYHKCLGVYEIKQQPEEVMSDEVCKLLSQWMRDKGQFLPGTSWKMFSSGITAAAALLKEVGLDPKRATINDICSANSRIVEIHSSYRINVMNLETALLRAIRRALCTHRLATESEIAAAKPLEAVRQAQIVDEDAKRAAYRCSHCDEIEKVTKDAVRQHLQDAHAITEATCEDYVDAQPTSIPQMTVHLFCPEKGPKCQWAIKDALEAGIGAYFSDWKDTTTTT